jgi:aspartate dehydrogenase
MTRVGLIGFGAIGRSIVDLWTSLPVPAYTLAAVCVRPAQVQGARSTLPAETLVCESVDQLLSTQVDCVIEAAGQQAVLTQGDAILRSGCSLYMLSVGSLAHDEVRAALMKAALAGNSHILIPSGALAGFDGLLTLTCDSLRSVKYTSTKPCDAWQGTPAAKHHDLDGLTQRTVIFRGTAGEAARQFPKNANLAAAVALAGIGFDKTQVELVADPHVSGNIGRLEAVSHSTTMTVIVESTPSSNPKTSANVGASVIAALRNSVARIRFV